LGGVDHDRELEAGGLVQRWIRERKNRLGATVREARPRDVHVVRVQDANDTQRPGFL